MIDPNAPYTVVTGPDAAIEPAGPANSDAPAGMTSLLLSGSFERLADALGTAIGAAGGPRADYARIKARTLAAYALMIAEARMAGDLDDPALAEELAELEAMVRRAALTLGAGAGPVGVLLTNVIGKLLHSALEGRLGPLEHITRPEPA